MNWVLQDKNFGLGNFINITPIIKYEYLRTGKKVPVFFETDFVKNAYLPSFMIDHLEGRPKNEPIFTSNYRCKANDMEDFRFAFEHWTGQKYSDKYKPWVPASPGVQPGFVAIVCGSGVEDQNYLNSKIPGDEVYIAMIQRLLEDGHVVTFVGSLDDYRRHPKIVMECDTEVIDNMGLALAAIRGADLVIGNDTGLIHAAGCYDKRTFVFWKNTPFPRCKNSGINTTYSQEGLWMEDFETFLNNI